MYSRLQPFSCCRFFFRFYFAGILIYQEVKFVVNFCSVLKYLPKVFAITHLPPYKIKVNKRMFHKYLYNACVDSPYKRLKCESISCFQNVNKLADFLCLPPFVNFLFEFSSINDHIYSPYICPRRVFTSDGLFASIAK